jgi:chorismate dehydratase
MTKPSEGKPRLAASSYLNTAPLIWSFTRGSRKGTIELVDAVPAQCARLLAQEQVEAALVPVIEYQRMSDINVVPGVCIGSRNQVRSVVLLTNGSDLRNLREIALDESSRTSAALIKIIFREFLGFEPKWTSHSATVDYVRNENEGALMIGDPAMMLNRDNLRVFDLASLWRKYTGLGFVFAMWMIREDASAAARTIDFRVVCEEGLAQTAGIIDAYEPILGSSRDDLRTYLTENISFFMDAELGAGLNLFYQLAHKHRLIPAVKPLKSFEP